MEKRNIIRKAITVEYDSYHHSTDSIYITNDDRMFYCIDRNNNMTDYNNKINNGKEVSAIIKCNVYYKNGDWIKEDTAHYTLKRIFKRDEYKYLQLLI